MSETKAIKNQLTNLIDIIHELDHRIRELESDMYDMRRDNTDLRRQVSDLESKKRMTPF